MCSLLRRVAEERGTQVVLTTHSRHVVDAIGSSCGFLWIRNGEVDKARPEDEVGILLDIGALDVKERVGQAGSEVIVLTEDEIFKPIEVILSSSGFDMSKTLILPYYGVTATEHLRPLVNVIKGVSNRAIIVVHRDRDFLLPNEVQAWETSVRAIGVEPFVTEARDLESSFINAAFLAEKNSELNKEEFEILIDETLKEKQTELVSDYVNGRVDIVRKGEDRANLNYGNLAVEAAKQVEKNARIYAGKAILRSLRGSFQTKTKQNLRVYEQSAKLKSSSAALIAAKAFRSHQSTSHPKTVGGAVPH